MSQGEWAGGDARCHPATPLSCPTLRLPPLPGIPLPRLLLSTLPAPACPPLNPAGPFGAAVDISVFAPFWQVEEGPRGQVSAARAAAAVRRAVRAER